VHHLLKRKDPFIAANHDFFASFDRNKSLKTYTFVVFDTELTGLNSRKDEIISIGAVKIERLQINLGEVFSAHVRPRRMQHTTATLIHKITPEELASARGIEEVLPEFISFLGRGLIVGHCINIDMGFLDRICRKLYGGTLANPTIDTMRLSRGYQGGLSGWYHDHGSSNKVYSLRDMSRKYQLPSFVMHDALGDALQTAYLFLYLVKKFGSGGLETLSDLYQAGKTGRWAGGV
jgi:DNA polymerase-3 subunit epsilon